MEAEVEIFTIFMRERKILELRNYLNIPIYCINVKYYDKNNAFNKRPQIIKWIGNQEAIG